MNVDIHYPRVLIISHNVLSKNTSMGKTMRTYFRGWPPDRIAQVYFHSEVPTTTDCQNYYKFTDIDAMLSIIFRNHTGHIITYADVDLNRDDAVDTGKFRNIYNYGRRRVPLVYLMRDGMWWLSAWDSKTLMEWIKKFDPEVIFFASGDYAFPYRIAYRIAERFSLPVVTCCFDDYYIYNKNEYNLLGKYRQNLFMHVARTVLERSQVILTVTELMSKAYNKMFQKPCRVLYTAANREKTKITYKKIRRIVYLGGLGLGRAEQLIDIGRALMELKDSLGGIVLDVYSEEKDPKTIKKMTKENGINFHGFVSSEQVYDIISSSLAVVHTESFVREYKERVKYSLSTKIPDSLVSGTCIFAYGPRDVASIDYLARYHAALVCVEKSELKEKLINLFIDEKLRNNIIKSAARLASVNHDEERIPRIVCRALNDAVDLWSKKRQYESNID